MVALTGCADEAVSPAPAGKTAPPSARATAAAVVAKGFARGMADAGVRVAIRDAMRASTYAEHKLILADFVASPAGEALIAAAVNGGFDRAELLDALAALPRMDFYAPFDEHRLSWTGGKELTVGATMNVDDPLLTAFTTDGAPVELDARHGLPRKVLFLIQPSEARATRDVPLAPGGSTIQDAVEPMLAMPIDDASDVPMATASAASAPPPADTTYVGKFTVFFGDGWGDSEVEFRSDFHSYSSVCCSRTARFENVPENVEQEGGKPVSFRVPREYDEFLNVNLVETDEFNDDWYGFREVRTAGGYFFAVDFMKRDDAFANFYFSNPANRAVLSRVAVSPASATMGIGNRRDFVATGYDQFNNPMDWLSFTWSTTAPVGLTTLDHRTVRVTASAAGSGSVTAVSGSVGGSAAITVSSLAVSVSQPSSVRAGATCTWFANTAGGSPPYRYSWSVNGATVGGNTGELTYKAGTSPFTIYVYVTDAAGVTIVGSRTITISSTASLCRL